MIPDFCRVFRDFLERKKYPNALSSKTTNILRDIVRLDNRLGRPFHAAATDD